MSFQLEDKENVCGSNIALSQSPTKQSSLSPSAPVALPSLFSPLRRVFASPLRFPSASPPRRVENQVKHAENVENIMEQLNNINMEAAQADVPVCNNSSVACPDLLDAREEALLLSTSPFRKLMRPALNTRDKLQQQANNDDGASQLHSVCAPVPLSLSFSELCDESCASSVGSVAPMSAAEFAEASAHTGRTHTHDHTQKLEAHNNHATCARCQTLEADKCNLECEVSHLNERLEQLQEEGGRLYKQYEIKCAMVKTTKQHNQQQQQYIQSMSVDYEALRSEYAELYNAYHDLEQLYINQQHNQEQQATGEQATMQPSNKQQQSESDAYHEQEKRQLLEQIQIANKSMTQLSMELTALKQLNNEKQQTITRITNVDHDAQIVSLTHQLNQLTAMHQESEVKWQHKEEQWKQSQSTDVCSTRVECMSPAARDVCSYFSRYSVLLEELSAARANLSRVEEVERGNAQNQIKHIEAIERMTNIIKQQKENHQTLSCQLQHVSAENARLVSELKEANHLNQQKLLMSENSLSSCLADVDCMISRLSYDLLPLLDVTSVDNVSSLHMDIAANQQATSDNTQSQYMLKASRVINQCIHQANQLQNCWKKAETQKQELEEFSQFELKASEEINKELSTRNADLSSQVCALMDTISAQSIELDESEHVRTSLKSTTEALADMRVHAAVKAHGFKLATNCVKLLNEQSQQLQQQIHCLNTQYIEAMNINQELIQQIEKQQSEKQQVEHSLLQCKQQRDELDMSLSSSRNDCLVLSSRISELECVVSTHSAESSELHTRIKHLEHKLESDAQQYAEDIQTLNSTIKQHIRDNQQMSEAMESLQSAVQQHKKKSKDQKSAIELLEQQVQQLQLQAIDAQTHIQKLTNSQGKTSIKSQNNENPASAHVEMESVRDELLASRSAAAAFEGKYIAIQHMMEKHKQESAENQQTLQQQINMTKVLEQENERLRSASTAIAQEKEQLLMQVEMLMSSVTQHNNTDDEKQNIRQQLSESSKQVAQLSAENVKMKSYVSEYKRRGDTRIHACLKQQKELGERTRVLVAAVLGQPNIDSQITKQAITLQSFLQAQAHKENNKDM